MIHKLVGEGIRNIKEMQRALRLYVKMELFEGQRPPPINSRRFYPEELYIRNYMYNATAKLRISKVDQENCNKNRKLGKKIPKIRFTSVHMVTRQHLWITNGDHFTMNMVTTFLG